MGLASSIILYSVSAGLSTMVGIALVIMGEERAIGI
jgi:hypothetical protein